MGVLGLVLLSSATRQQWLRSHVDNNNNEKKREEALSLLLRPHNIIIFNNLRIIILWSSLKKKKNELHEVLICRVLLLLWWTQTKDAYAKGLFWNWLTQSSAAVKTFWVSRPFRKLRVNSLCSSTSPYQWSTRASNLIRTSLQSHPCVCFYFFLFSIMLIKDKWRIIIRPFQLLLLEYTR